MATGVVGRTLSWSRSAFKVIPDCVLIVLYDFLCAVLSNIYYKFQFYKNKCIPTNYIFCFYVGKETANSGSFGVFCHLHDYLSQLDLLGISLVRIYLAP